MRIFEAITNIPNPLGPFFKSCKQEIDQTIISVQHDLASFLAYEKNPDNDQYMLREFMYNKLDLYEPTDYTFRQFLKLLEDMSHNCESVLNYGKDFFKYFKSSLEFLHDEQQRSDITIWKNAYDDVKPRILSYFGYDDENVDEPDEAYIAIIDAFKSIQSASRTVIKFYSKMDRYVAVMKALEKRSAYEYYPEKYRPDHDEVEKLYHVSLYCADLTKDGFQTKKPENRLGVGNFGHQHTISFTHSQAVAQSILRAFREIWMIVHGQLKPSTILSWIDHEGISHNDIKKGIGGFHSDDKTKYVPKTLMDTLQLYRHYLGLQKIRINPWIVNLGDLAEAMKHVDYSSIGMLSCEVKLDGSETYHNGEAEFRVMPEQVLSISRIS